VTCGVNLICNVTTNVVRLQPSLLYIYIPPAVSQELALRLRDGGVASILTLLVRCRAQRHFWAYVVSSLRQLNVYPLQKMSVNP
jgi:hypothetical protein